MGKHIKNVRATMERNRAKALAVFQQLAIKAKSDAYETFITAEAGLKALGPVESIYAREVGDLNAINAVLEYEERWMSPQQIANELHLGGYPMDPERGIGYMVQNIGRHAKRGNLQRVDELIGKLDWKYPGTA